MDLVERLMEPSQYDIYIVVMRFNLQAVHSFGMNSLVRLSVTPWRVLQFL